MGICWRQGREHSPWGQSTGYTGNLEHLEVCLSRTEGTAETKVWKQLDVAEEFGFYLKGSGQSLKNDKQRLNTVNIKFPKINPVVQICWEWRGDKAYQKVLLVDC